jgi:hypothetical protein
MCVCSGDHAGHAGISPVATYLKFADRKLRIGPPTIAVRENEEGDCLARSVMYVSIDIGWVGGGYHPSRLDENIIMPSKRVLATIMQAAQKRRPTSGVDLEAPRTGRPGP